MPVPSRGTGLHCRLVEPTKLAWINGQFGATVSAYDPGWQQGLGVFETIGVFDGPDPLPLWSRHFARLADGASLLGFPSAPPDDLRGAAEELLERNAGDDVLRVMRTEQTWSLTTRTRSEGADCQTLAVSEFRRHRSDPLASIKSNSYGFHVLARRAAIAAGADDALLLDAAGRVLETTTGNVFCVRAGRLCTPAASGGFLEGVGRAAILEQLAHASRAVEECDLGVEDLAAASAIFTTNAVHGPRPAALLGSTAAPLPPGVIEAWRCAIEPGGV